jgi:putative ABC transport system permease protein
MSHLRDAYRTLRATPVVTLVAISSLALGIGANTAIFSLVDSLMLRALPVRAPDQLVHVLVSKDNSGWTNPLWEQIRHYQHETFDGAVAWSMQRFNLAARGPTDLVDGMYANGDLFDVLGVPAVSGRTFTARDDVRGGGPDGPVAVVSYAFWQRRLGGAADVIGRTLSLERVPFTIIGVTPPAFLGPTVGQAFDVVVPIGTEALIRGRDSSLDERSSWWLEVLARLKPGQTAEAAEQAFRGLQPILRRATLPTDWQPSQISFYLKDPFSVVPAATGASYLRTRYERPLETLMVVVGLVLLIACANIANLLLARGASRRRELSIRLALGASRASLARQLLSESLLLSGVGALLGLLVARWGSALLVHQLSSRPNGVVLDLSLDWRVLGFTAFVAITTAVLFGTAPAFRATRVDPNEALKAQGRGVSGRSGGLGQALVVAQLAVSLVLLVAAGLFVRTFTALATRDLGFRPAPILVVSVNAARSAVEPARRGDLYERVRQSVANLPGVSSAALSMVTPVSGSMWAGPVDVLGGPPVGPLDRGVHKNLVTPDWFGTYGMAIRRGRDFTSRDTLASPPVAIVNETFVRSRLGQLDPIGQRLTQPGRPGDSAPPLEIVGVVADAVYRNIRDPAPPTMYVPLSQRKEPASAINVSLRAAALAPGLLTKSVTSAIGDVDRDLALSFRLLADQVNASLIQERVIAMLSGFFGGLALVLAGLGLYGVTSYSVSRRRAEIGLRLALGAQPGAVLRLVLRRVALLQLGGIGCGAAMSFWASPLVSTLLFGLQPRDPWTLATAAGLLLTIGALAGWAPARRAAALDPAHVLREDA